MKVLDMTYVEAMPEAEPVIHGNVLQSPRNSSNLAMQKKKKKNKENNKMHLAMAEGWGLLPIARSGAYNSHLCYGDI